VAAVTVFRRGSGRVDATSAMMSRPGCGLGGDAMVALADDRVVVMVAGRRSGMVMATARVSRADVVVMDVGLHRRGDQH
jgi:hypothetical protein